MKSMYWKSSSVSTPQLVVVAVLAAVGAMLLELNPAERRDPLFEEKMQAARLAERAYRAISVERIRRQIPLEPDFDPAGSGLIGPPLSPIVSNQGHLGAKQTSANPNFAAVFVEMLAEVGADRGDYVAANFTGSFPALNIAMEAAFEARGVRPLIVSSVAASEYGATNPELTWLDMERVLHEDELVSFESRAVTMGGVRDIADGHSAEGQELIRAAIQRSGRPFLRPNGYDEAMQMRLDLYDQARGRRPIAAFINIGGGTASVGTADDKGTFLPGVNVEVPEGLEQRSVMRSFLERDTPVIHVSHIRELAERYGLPTRLQETPPAGEGGVFTEVSVRPWLIVLTLALILVALYLATRFDLSTSFRRGREKKSAGPMV